MTLVNDIYMDSFLKFENYFHKILTKHTHTHTPRKIICQWEYKESKSLRDFHKTWNTVSYTLRTWVCFSFWVQYCRLFAMWYIEALEEIFFWMIFISSKAGVPCYRLNVFISLKTHMLKPNLQCNSIWWWGLQEMIRSWGGAFMNGISLYKRDTRILPGPFYHEKTQHENSSL